MKIDLLGVKIDAVKHIELLSRLDKIFESNKKSLIFTPNTEIIMRAQKDQDYKEILKSGELNLADGIGLLWAARFLSLKKIEFPVLGKIITILEWIFSIICIVIYPNFIKKPIPERISGADFVWELSKYAEKNSLRLFLLGGASTIAERAALKLQTDIYGLKIAGVSSLSPNDTKEILRLIEKAKADILLVAYGAPKQEIWLAENLSKSCAHLGVGVGGTFDFLSGAKKRAPKWVRKLGLEWLHRLINEPKRISRQLSIPKFMLIVLFEKLR